MKRHQKEILFCFVLAVLLSGIGCGGARRTEQAPKSRTLPPFEQDLDYVRKGQFAHVYVISRSDGAPLTREDIAYLKANSHPETNMWVITDEGRRAIAGTNFDWTPENFAALGKRFVVEDYTGR